MARDQYQSLTDPQKAEYGIILRDILQQRHGTAFHEGLVDWHLIQLDKFRKQRYRGYGGRELRETLEADPRKALSTFVRTIEEMEESLERRRRLDKPSNAMGPEIIRRKVATKRAIEDMREGSFKDGSYHGR